MDSPYDALLIVSFGGPEGPADVMPFLENVVRGRTVPRERLREVAHHYELFGGVSPLNAENRQLIAALESELSARGPELPIYWGNRNWHPLLADTIREMSADGVKRALAFVTSAFSSFSGCRQYLENLEQARQAVGPAAPAIDKLRSFYNHPGFIGAMTDRVQESLASFSPDQRSCARLVFTAHSIPQAMAAGSRYVAELREACRLVAGRLGVIGWDLVYQSRSGPPTQPWLEPDVCDFLRDHKRKGDDRPLVLVPIGFLSDHLEVLYDLDTEASSLAGELGIAMVRAPTVGRHPNYVSMIRELVLERLADSPRRALGERGPSPDFCPADCCPVIVPEQRAAARSDPDPIPE